jgi:hypothetical protein
MKLDSAFEYLIIYLFEIFGSAGTILKIGGELDAFAAAAKSE